ncbi:hypothetical protein ONZ45_g15092 [Pleurotus djamor]|nr:hypothetical protein ONZ45_g15092 [Pleurotus djamor]
MCLPLVASSVSLDLGNQRHFINTFFDVDVVEVGDELTSCTSEVYPVALDKGPRRYVFVDTPGFDDTSLPDVEVLARVAHWLKTTYSQDVKLTGVIFTLNISVERLPSVSLKIVDMMHELCGNNAAGKLVFYPTMTDQIAAAGLAQRLRDIGSDPRVARLFTLGAQWAEPEHPWKAIDLLCPPDATTASSQTVLQIQQEMVDFNRKPCQTRAAVFRTSDLNEQRNARKAYNKLARTLGEEELHVPLAKRMSTTLPFSVFKKK